MLQNVGGKYTVRVRGQSLRYHLLAGAHSPHVDLTVVTRVRVPRISGYLWTKVKYRVEGDVFYLLRFFLTMPSRDTPASSRTEASMAALVFSAARRRGRTRK